LGLNNVGFDYKRLIYNARVVDNSVCYNQKIYLDIAQVFKTRYLLFKDCYTHRVCRAIDHMVVDALLEADPVFKFTEVIFDPNRYVNMTDSLLTHIELSKNPFLKKS
jgi:HD superfamily phosphohydrolase